MIECCVQTCDKQATMRVKLTNSWQFDCCQEHAKDFHPDIVEVQADLTLEPPPRYHVRLSCGCLLDWLEPVAFQIRGETVVNAAPPKFGMEAECQEHGEVRVASLNPSDWESPF